MKKTYIFILSVIFGISTVMGQVSFQKNDPIQLNQPYPYLHTKAVDNKTINCTDTVRYPGSKLTGLVEADTMDYSTYIGAVSQAYYFSGSGTIDGISAYVLLDLDGIPANSPPISMIIKGESVQKHDFSDLFVVELVQTVHDIELHIDERQGQERLEQQGRNADHVDY